MKEWQEQIKNLVKAIVTDSYAVYANHHDYYREPQWSVTLIRDEVNQYVTDTTHKWQELTERKKAALVRRICDGFVNDGTFGTSICEGLRGGDVRCYEPKDWMEWIEN